MNIKKSEINSAVVYKYWIVSFCVDCSQCRKQELITANERTVILAIRKKISVRTVGIKVK